MEISAYPISRGSPATFGISAVCNNRFYDLMLGTVSYSLKMKMFTANKHELTCIEFDFSVCIKDQQDEETELEFSVGGQGLLPISSNTIISDEHTTQEVKEDNEEHPVLSDFEEKCPPGGEDSVVFYTTSLRGIRKTFEDCSSIRFLLDSFKILVQERDVSMDMRFREELWRIYGGRVVPPKLFIKGREIGGADEVIRLHEQGKLKKLLEGIPSNSMCTDCDNIRFLICSNCNGSRQVFTEKEGDELCMKCPDCNENGLVKCPVCC
ncbi:uncharacterized protein At5g39865-like [Hibiscus syriacus]|uniref:uncharacterized protein At5g39865-like n=1 Tax=Hibiscus syriacus TaxID=106335 RepID=UPI0019242D19|nr:uncharacterized protein At5g39865-like [Hibiscus syriacus]